MPAADDHRLIPWEEFFGTDTDTVSDTDTDTDTVSDTDPCADEGSPCYDGPEDNRNVGACADGTFVCVDGALECDGAVWPAPETSNGIDDDCDGTVDNGTPDALAPRPSGLQAE